MTDGLVIRLLRVASYMNDIGENGYEVETIKKPLYALMQCWQVYMRYL